MSMPAVTYARRMSEQVRQLRLVVEAADFDEAVAFYRDVLGLDVELDLESEAARTS